MTTATLNPPTVDNDITTETGPVYGTKIAFESIDKPGCYVSNATGHLFRVYSGFEPETWTAWFDMEGDEPFWFTYVSENPACDNETARDTAARFDIDCNF